MGQHHNSSYNNNVGEVKRLIDIWANEHISHMTVKFVKIFVKNAGAYQGCPVAASVESVESRPPLLGDLLRSHASK